MWCVERLDSSNWRYDQEKIISQKTCNFLTFLWPHKLLETLSKFYDEFKWNKFKRSERQVAIPARCLEPICTPPRNIVIESIVILVTFPLASLRLSNSLVSRVQVELMETNTVDEGAPKPVGAVTAPREGGGIPSSATNMPHSLEAAIHRCVWVLALLVWALVCLCVSARGVRASEICVTNLYMLSPFVLWCEPHSVTAEAAIKFNRSAASWLQQQP